MATTFADLEARVRGLESRAQRSEEDITAIIGTVMETRDDVKELKHDVSGLTHDVSGLKHDVSGLKQDVSGLKHDVKWLKLATQAMLDHNGLRVDDDPRDGEV